jgi:hypothetical protein
MEPFLRQGFMFLFRLGLALLKEYKWKLKLSEADNGQRW